MHRPLYVPYLHKDNAVVGEHLRASLEELFVKQGVDLVLSGKAARARLSGIAVSYGSFWLRAVVQSWGPRCIVATRGFHPTSLA